MTTPQTPYGVVYVVTNVVNGKQYVGQTTSSSDVRWRDHKYYALVLLKDWPLSRAIRSYGPESFEVQLFCSCLSRSALDDAEVSAISELGTLTPSGYNVRSGGHRASVSDLVRSRACETALARVYTPEIRHNMSKAALGKPKSDKARQNMRASKRKYQYNNRLWTLPELLESGLCHTTLSLAVLSRRVNSMCWSMEEAVKTSVGERRATRLETPTSDDGSPSRGISEI